jgi:hypothetical protein
MSELAFNINGEKFEPPAATVAWRVRRLKPGGRGTPDVVFGGDGAPLMAPVEADLAEFRKLINGEPGRYRLDPVDEGHRPCEGGMPAYLMISEESAVAAVERRVPQSDDLMRELLRANTEMVRSMADRFASVMEAAATLLRAADGAGMPARQPPAPEQPEVDGEDDDDDDEADDGRPPRSEMAELITMVAPLIAAHLGGGKSAGGKPAAKSAPAAAPAGAGAAAGSPARNQEDGAGEAAGDPAPAPSVPPNALAHVAAIQQKLSPKEAALAREAAKELTPSEIQAWMAQLSSLSVDEAVALIRKTIAGQGGDERSAS